MDLSSSHQAAEGEGELDQSKEGFEVFDLVDQSEDPSGDIGDPALSEANCHQLAYLPKPRWDLRESPQPAYSTSSRVNQGRVCREHHSPALRLHHLSPRPSRLGHPPQSRSHNLPAPNFLLLPNQLYLLGRGPLTQRERGVLRVRKPWMEENPNLLRRGMKPRV